ncbi:MAG: type II toxin-antitoxin system RelE/ParE family toxin [Chloroflexi bacterium]|nr:type II toxin-antitoxin system RelE/ParE family toxin [Chloroflexota bacterium]
MVDLDVLDELDDVKRYPAKIARQILIKILALASNPYPSDGKKIREGCQVDSGEYRIYYHVDEETHFVTVLLVGKRNDDEVYQRLRRKLGW